MTPFSRPALVGAAIASLGIWTGVWMVGSPAPRHDAHTATSAHARPRIDATSDAEARQMRGVVNTLAGQAATGARCDPNDPPAQYAPCVIPALRQLGIGGRMGANVLTVVAAGVPFGACRGYLLGLQSAMQGAGDDARWLLPRVYGPDRQRAQHEVAIQVVLIVRMLRHAAGAAPADVCSIVATGPAV